MMSIFLSYRRADSADALCLYPWLIQWYGRERVFWDRKDIHPGETFSDVLENQVRSSKAFVALLGENWLSATDAGGNRRIDSPGDWIRRETLLALQQEILIIPVLAGGTACPPMDDLPHDLRKIAGLQMLSTGDINFHDRLRERLDSVMPTEEKEFVASGEAAIRLQRRASTLLRSQIKRLQVRAVELIQERQLDRAIDELTEGSELLMALLDLLPGDTSLDAQLGYLFGTAGQALLRGGDTAQADRYFDRAVSIFRRVEANPEVFRERPADLASAIKGIGGAFYERGDHVRAIQFYRRALDILDNYPEAWHDLFAAYNELAKRGTIDIPAMQQAVDKLHEMGAALGAAKIEMFEQILRQWRARAAQPPVNGGEAHLDVLPEFLEVVITESNPHAAIFNLYCRLTNHSKSEVTVQNLQVEVTGPDRLTALFKWHWFYDFRPSQLPKEREMQATGEAKAFGIAPGQTIAMGIQFTDPQSHAGRLWGQGDFTFQLSGSYNDDQRLKRTFGVRLGDKEAGDVITLRSANRAFWDRWSDADRAIGVPAWIVAADPAGNPR
jgi:tetratricopeptide (TPR) repeat protein